MHLVESRVTCEGILGVGGCHVKMLTMNPDQGQAAGSRLGQRKFSTNGGREMEVSSGVMTSELSNMESEHFGMMIQSFLQ